MNFQGLRCSNIPIQIELIELGLFTFLTAVLLLFLLCFLKHLEHNFKLFINDKIFIQWDIINFSPHSEPAVC